MVATINASVSSSGIVSTADGSGILKVQSNGKTTNALAWVNWATTGTITSAYNVSSVTQNATGFFTINFTNALSDNTYCWAHSVQSPGSAPSVINESSSYTNRSTTQLGVDVGYYYSGSWIPYSSFNNNCVIVFGN